MLAPTAATGYTTAGRLERENDIEAGPGEAGGLWGTGGINVFGNIEHCGRGSGGGGREGNRNLTGGVAEAKLAPQVFAEMTKSEGLVRVTVKPENVTVVLPVLVTVNDLGSAGLPLHRNRKGQGARRERNTLGLSL